MTRYSLRPSSVTFLALLILSLGIGAAAQPSGLTAAEQRDGWKLLFDGQTLKGWTPRAPGAGRGGATEAPPTGKWAAEKGEIVWVKDSGRGYLVTEQVFTDFVLRLDFWSDAAANTGVNFGVPDAGNISSNVSFEVNIFDDTEQFPTGSINNVQRTSAAAPKTTEKWNSYEIARQGDHVTVVLNGATVVDIKTVLHPGGHIALQAPAAGVTRFRNLRVKTQ
jgi:Domain of Unknown Function (DUF1080)